MSAGERPLAEFSAYTREPGRTAVVPTTPVEADVEEFQLTPAASTKVAPGAVSSRTKVGAFDGGSQPVSAPSRLGTPRWVSPGARRGEVTSDQATYEARTLDDGTWSDWIQLPYDDDNGPYPESAEGQHARPGTDILLVDEVQVRSSTTEGDQPRDMKLAVIAPGTHVSTWASSSARVSQRYSIGRRKRTRRVGVAPGPNSPNVIARW